MDTRNQEWRGSSERDAGLATRDAGVAGGSFHLEGGLNRTVRMQDGALWLLEAEAARQLESLGPDEGQWVQVDHWRQARLRGQPRLADLFLVGPLSRTRGVRTTGRGQRLCSFSLVPSSLSVSSASLSSSGIRAGSVSMSCSSVPIRAPRASPQAGVARGAEQDRRMAASHAMVSACAHLPHRLQHASLPVQLNEEDP